MARKPKKARWLSEWFAKHKGCGGASAISPTVVLCKCGWGVTLGAPLGPPHGPAPQADAAMTHGAGGDG